MNHDLNHGMGGICVNDRAVSVLENYEIEVLRTWKGRGAILCESDKGLLILKEYQGPGERIAFQDTLLTSIRRKGLCPVEAILRTKDGELVVYDSDKVPYILKTYFEGRECNIRDVKECIQAVRTLALLHKASEITDMQLSGKGISEFKIDKEYEKHNRELRKVRKFLKEKSQKTNFEIFLQKNYDYFFNLAVQVAEEVWRYREKTPAAQENKRMFACHGDYQYHNILIAGPGMAVVNFEKCIVDNPVRDLYLFMRKLLEKSDWSQELGRTLIESYDKERTMTEEDFTELYYRLAYPEKFWKIVNFYFNSGKAWIPSRNLEKLQKLLEQEEKKVAFLENYKSTYGCFSFEER